MTSRCRGGYITRRFLRRPAGALILQPGLHVLDLGGKWRR